MDTIYFNNALKYSLQASEARNEYARMTLEQTADYWWRLFTLSPNKYWTETRLLNPVTK